MLTQRLPLTLYGGPLRACLQPCMQMCPAVPRAREDFPEPGTCLAPERGFGRQL